MELSVLKDLDMVRLPEQGAIYESIGSSTEIKLNNFLDNLNNNSNYEILFRGTNFEYLTEIESFEESELLKRVFIVGDKAKRFFDNHLREVFDNNILENELKSFKDLDIATILRRMSDDYYKRNTELRALIHFLKEKQGYSMRSDSFMSTTLSLNSALVFVNGGYIIVLFEKQKHIFNAEDLKTIVGEEESFLIDCEKEYMISQAIFPNKIIGIINPEHKFIINPWLIKKLETGDEIFDFDIPVDQTFFDQYRKELGYQDETYDNFRI
ncbi:MAG: hypothetical protein E6316_08685 [Streptococcus sp.]|mgnify:FL=1|nr:hypothetical protein [Streptococcus sp.]